MVSPVILIAATLGFAFLYPLIERVGRVFAVRFALVVIAAFTVVIGGWTVDLIAGAAPLVSETAGFVAPLSIRLEVGLMEGIVLSVISLIALAALAQSTLRDTDPWDGKRIVLFFVMILGAYGLVMTQDLFNVFVFLEISGISLFGLLSTSKDGRVFEAGFKYMVASGLASVFFLIGVAFIYRTVGSLAIADIIESAPLLSAPVGILGLLFLVTGLLIELKPAPANGWAIDTYQAADPGISALISAVNASAVAVVLVRIVPILVGAAGELFLPLLLGAGTVAFVVPQIQALRQESFTRLLGYSSVAQIGLFILAVAAQPGDVSLWVVSVSVPIVLLLNHGIAKAVLFWITDISADDRTGLGETLPPTLRGRPILAIAATLGVLALLGLPPFPGFWAKWSLVMHLGASGSYWVLGAVLVGSLLEVIYLGRWLVIRLRYPGDDATVTAERIPVDFAERDVHGNPTVPDGDCGCIDDDDAAIAAQIVGATGARGGQVGIAILGPSLAIGIALAALFGITVGAVAASGVGWTVLFVVAAIVSLAVLELIHLPNRATVLIAGGALGWLTVTLVVSAGSFGLREAFVVLFGGGTAIQLIAFLACKRRHPGLIPLTAGLAIALLALAGATTGLELFVAWELMSIISFLLVLRGHAAAAAAVRYVVFSLGSAFLMLAALAVGLTVGGTAPTVAAVQTGPVLDAVTGPLGFIGSAHPWATVLLLAAILIKLGTVGVHVWLPSTYAEAEHGISAIASSVLSKAGVLILFFGATIFTMPLIEGVALNDLLGWLGVATALIGGMAALFQEDIKYTLAYSSMSQLGYILLAFAVVSHLGWVTALYLVVNHLLFKGMLFLAVAGIIMRTGTRLMYQMGGLIKRMPFSFVSVLVAIIAVSGVPPLSGFGGKWLLYTALLEKGWYLQAGLAMFSSGIAFLYLFRLIHTIFLGQRKGYHDTVKESPWPLLVPQFIFLIAIMAISMYPNLLIKPLQMIVEPAFASSIQWDGYAVVSTLGYWNGNAVMYVVMGVFITPLLWLLAVKGRVYRVEQFNIVYAAERPHTPESTHYAYSFYGHYKKAFGRLVDPWVERFWRGVSDTAGTVSETLRAWNTGNPQTYAFQIVLYLLLTYLFVRGGL